MDEQEKKHLIGELYDKCQAGGRSLDEFIEELKSGLGITSASEPLPPVPGGSNPPPSQPDSSEEPVNG